MASAKCVIRCGGIVTAICLTIAGALPWPAASRAGEIPTEYSQPLEGLDEREVSDILNNFGHEMVVCVAFYQLVVIGFGRMDEPPEFLPQIEKDRRSAVRSGVGIAR